MAHRFSGGGANPVEIRGFGDRDREPLPQALGGAYSEVGVPLEIEAKFRVPSHDAICSRLRELRAERIGLVMEMNHIFDKSDRSLYAADCGLRVRAFTVIHGPARPSTLTYKGPRAAGPLKTREEIETPIGDADVTCRILTFLGFVEVLQYEKRRESWRFSDCEIELDELPHLGCYVEIEGPDEAAVRSVQDAVGFGSASLIADSYIAILLAYCDEQRLATRRITFSRD